MREGVLVMWEKVFKAAFDWEKDRTAIYEGVALRG